VVIEEFKQRYLNQPYGDVWLRLRAMAYKVHPYTWATIGKEISHIEAARMEDVKAFFDRFYTPNNAILVLSGQVKTHEVKRLAEKWFAEIPVGPDNKRNLPKEPIQTKARREEVMADVPVPAIYLAFHSVERLHADYQIADLITDILSRGTSSRLYRRLVKEKKLFSEVNAYILGSLDSNLLVIEGKPSSQITIAEAEEAIWEELEELKQGLVSNEELNKVKNKIESTLVF